MKYTFVYKNNCWWLKITTIQQLIEYDEHELPKWYSAFSNLMNSKEFGNGMEHANELAFVIGMRSERKQISSMKATADLKAQKFSAQMDCLIKGQSIYINRKGGWHPVDKNIKDYTEWYTSDSLIYPQFKKSELRIKKFPGGIHYYAYIGDLQLRDNDTIKWNTYEEAYDYAKQFLE